MTYEQFIAESQRLQRTYIAREFVRFEKARKAWSRYRETMSDLGLHPLTPDEISARWRQLQDMSKRVPETHGDTPGQRAIYEMHVS